MTLLVCVDGIDLAGKSTLVRALVAELQRRGRTARRHRGMMARRHPLDRLLRHLSSARQPDSWLTTTAYLIGGFALDSLLVRGGRRKAKEVDVIIQDGGVDRTAAFGIAGGPYRAARVALRWPGVFARCDLAVHVTAGIETRAERLARRIAEGHHVDVRDHRAAGDAAFSARFHSALAVMGRRHRRLIALDTTDRDPQEMASELADRILALPGDRRR
ncbi:hypothetical protein [Kitasatospora sp. NPDC088779]|uniref:hypothetical protein n=1 Tax=Kitasatospora sp. NPDC088779 TaxID=3154964 RepID=UPI00341610CB